MTIKSDTLVTGGTGFLGRWLVSALTRHGRDVVVLARGGANRAADLVQFVDSHGGDSQRLTVIDGDLRAEGLGIEAELVGIVDVYHLAAAFSFGMTSERAREVNLGGTLRVAQWALAQPNLRRLIHLGGYRSTALPAWLSGEPYPLRPAISRRLYSRRGAYEASKIESHLAMKDFATRNALPLTTVHPSSVIGHSVSGETSQLTGIGETVERLWQGKLRALVGSNATFLPLVSVDYLSEFMVSVPTRDETLGQDLCVLDPSTPKLPALIAEIADHLGVPAPTRILAKALVARLPKAVTGINKEALEFLVEDEYDTETAQAHAQASGLQMPERGLATRRWATHLIATRFGKAADADPGRFVPVQGSRTYVVGDANTAEMIFLHGLPWDGDSGKPLAQALAAEIARPDLPGMGRSSATDVEREAWLSDLLSERSKPVLLIAHSLSTGTALRYAQRHPDRVSGLVLVSPFFLQSRPPWYLRLAILSKRLLRLGSARSMQRRLLDPSSVTSDSALHPAVQSAHDNLARPGVAAQVARALAAAGARSERAELRAALDACRHPLLIIHGQHDPLLGASPRQRVTTIAACGHNPHLESPRDVAAAIRAWAAEAREAADTAAGEPVRNGVPCANELPEPTSPALSDPLASGLRRRQAHPRATAGR